MDKTQNSPKNIWLQGLKVFFLKDLAAKDC
jgi:hypothetical protein